MTPSSKTNRKGLFIYGLYFLLLFSLGIPLLHLVTIWLLALPFLLFAANVRSTILFIPFIIACALPLVLINEPLLMATVFFAAVTGSAMGMVYRRRKSTGLEVVMSGFLAGGASLLLLVLIGYSYGLVDPVKELWQNQWIEMGKLLQSYGMDNEQILAAPPPVEVIFPLMIAIPAFFISLFNLWVGRWALVRWGFPGKYMPRFREWRLPRSFFFFYLIIFLISLFDVSFQATIISILLLLYPLFYLQGLSFVAFLLHRAGKGKLWLLIIVFVSLPVAEIVRLLGILDTGTQIREVIDKRKKMRED